MIVIVLRAVKRHGLYNCNEKIIVRFFFFGPAGTIIRMTNPAHVGNVGGRQCQTLTD